MARYFAREKADLDRLEAEAETALIAAEGYVEELVVEEGLLWHAVEDDKINMTTTKRRLKETRTEECPDPEEVAALERALELFTAEAMAKKAARDAKATLALATLEKYGDLDEPAVKALVLDDKWAATVGDRVEETLTSLLLGLVKRIDELGDRYGRTLGEIEGEVVDLRGEVAAHLANLDPR